jgi:hypothetical protein
MSFSEDNTFAMSYNLLTLAVSPIEETKLAFFFISISTHIAAELNSGNMGINFSYWTPHGLL